MSEAFGVTRGLRHGCVLSLLLFSLYINSLVEKVRVAIKALLYADDAVIFAKSEEE